MSCAPHVSLCSICARPLRPCALEGQLEMASDPDGQQSPPSASHSFTQEHQISVCCIPALSIQCKQKDSGQACEGLTVLKEMSTGRWARSRVHPLPPTLVRLRQEDHGKFEVRMAYNLNCTKEPLSHQVVAAQAFNPSQHLEGGGRSISVSSRPARATQKSPVLS